MNVTTLVCDYDWTLAQDGVVAPQTVHALWRLSRSGRKLVLATGRQLRDLLAIFPDLPLFDLVVAENGALLYNPCNQQLGILATPPPESFVAELAKQNVRPLAAGYVIVATNVEYEAVVARTIRQMGLPLEAIRNKDALMILPAGLDKATGVMQALAELGVDPATVVGVGDAENDQTFLKICGCAVAVANALPVVKQTADVVLTASYGAGVAELIAGICSGEFSNINPAPRSTPCSPLCQQANR